ncbi:MAG: hypothetical protein ACWIPH_10075 [Ostreibacterium sp.]
MKKHINIKMILLAVVIAGCTDKPATITAQEDTNVVNICATKSPEFSRYLYAGINVKMFSDEDCENELRKILLTAIGNTSEQHKKRQDLLQTINDIGLKIDVQAANERYYTSGKHIIYTTKLFSTYLK